MNGTLPLFQELDSPFGAPSTGSDPLPPAAAGPPPAAAAPPRAAAPARDKHLRAAWRLSRAMKRLPDRSPEQIRAGLAICRHLQALLAESDPTS